MIPEKWKVQRWKSNALVLNKWNNEHPLYKEQDRETAVCDSDDGDIFYSDRRHTGVEANILGYTLITFDEFVEFVLNKSQINNTYVLY